MAAGAQMWQSEMFTEDQIIAWENRTSAMQTWTALQTYFTEKWLERKQYSATTAKQLRFKEAALQAQEAAAAEEEGETQAMLFAMLQDQHTKQIAQMEAKNKANMSIDVGPFGVMCHDMLLLLGSSSQSLIDCCLRFIYHRQSIHRLRSVCHSSQSIHCCPANLSVFVDPSIFVVPSVFVDAPVTVDPSVAVDLSVAFDPYLTIVINTSLAVSPVSVGCHDAIIVEVIYSTSVCCRSACPL
jgi:hypothetical protein